LSINSFLHDPSWSKVDGSAFIATGSLLVLGATRWLYVRRRKRDIYKPSVLLSEAFAAEDPDDEIEFTRPSKRKPGQISVPRWLKSLTAVLGVMCITVSVIGYLFALQGYIILSNWSDGTSRMLIGDFVGSIVCYKKALRADPSLRHSHYLIGDSLLRSGRIGSAIPELETATKGEKSDPEPSAVLGDAYQLVNKPSEAMASYHRAASLDPSSAKYPMAIANCLETLHRLDDAYQAYERAIHLEPDNYKAHMKLGALLISNGHLDEGIAHCKRAIALAPNEVLPHNTLATAYTQFGMFADAVEEYRKTISLDPKFPIAFYDYGATLERMGEYERALEAFKTCSGLKAHNTMEQSAIDKAAGEVRKLSPLVKHKTQVHS